MLEQRILDTLRFFGLQGVPLTLFELHKYLITDLATLREYVNDKFEFTQSVPSSVETSIEETLVALEQLISENRVIEAHGYYVLANNGTLLGQRWRGHKYGVKRERLIRKFSFLFKYIPFIRGVALDGSQALGLEKDGSDIDLFIITAPNFLWIARTAITFVLQLFGIRRHDRHIANRFCLNHYVAGPRSLKEKNLYTALEYSKLRPLVYGGAIAQFQKENASWIRACFPNMHFVYSAVVHRSFLQRVIEIIFQNPIGRWIETRLGTMQRKRIHTDEFVVVRDEELSFHPNSKQEKLLQEFFGG